MVLGLDSHAPARSGVGAWGWGTSPNWEGDMMKLVDDNAARVVRGLDVVRHYGAQQFATGEEFGTTAADCIADILHAAITSGWDPELLLDRAVLHFVEELGHPVVIHVARSRGASTGQD